MTFAGQILFAINHPYVRNRSLIYHSTALTYDTPTSLSSPRFVFVYSQHTHSFATNSPADLFLTSRLSTSAFSCIPACILPHEQKKRPHQEPPSFIPVYIPSAPSLLLPSAPGTHRARGPRVQVVPWRCASSRSLSSRQLRTSFSPDEICLL